MSLVDKIKNDIKKSGSNKSKIFFVRDGEKVRIRFLRDVEEGKEIIFHDSYSLGINVPCQETFGRTCKYCDEEGLRTRAQYVWPIWNYDKNEVQLFMFAVNNCSPVPALLALYENYGTIMDRDYVISVNGKGTSKTYSVIPMDKAKFRVEKAKPFSLEKTLQILDKAFPSDETEDDDEDYEEKPKRKKSINKKSKKERVDDDNDDYAALDEDELPESLKKNNDYEDDWDEDDEEESYREMSPKELYSLCKHRGIECKPRKNKIYYINLLEEDDEIESEWGDDDE